MANGLAEGWHELSIEKIGRVISRTMELRVKGKVLRSTAPDYAGFSFDLTYAAFGVLVTHFLEQVFVCEIKRLEDIKPWMTDWQAPPYLTVLAACWPVPMKTGGWILRTRFASPLGALPVQQISQQLGRGISWNEIPASRGSYLTVEQLRELADDRPRREDAPLVLGQKSEPKADVAVLDAYARELFLDDEEKK